MYNLSSPDQNIQDSTNSLFACWFQPGLISQPTVFSSHNKPVPAGLISLETNQRILFLCHELRNLCDLSGNSLIGSGFRTLIGVGVIIIDNVYRGHPSKPIFCIKLQIHTCTVIYSFFLSFKRKLNPTQCM